jgi:hypothetical protein
MQKNHIFSNLGGGGGAENIWAEIYRGRLFIRAEIYRGRFFFFKGRSFFRGEIGRSNDCPFLNKLIVSCKEAVRFSF